MKKALIFGASGVGLKVKQKLNAEGVQVLAFSDNNPEKWYTKLQDTPVIPPDSIKSESYDIVAIGVYKHVEVIKAQLLTIGISEKKIIVPIVPDRVFYNNRLEIPSIEMEEQVVIIWGGIENANKSIQDGLKNLPHKRIDFHNNFWGFQYFVEDCLTVENSGVAKDFWKKYSVTDFPQLCVDVYIAKGGDCIEDLRKKMFQEERVFFCSDSPSIAQMVSNRNTEMFWRYRFPREFPKEFLLRISNLKKKMIEYNIPVDEVCVVSGAVLEAYGLRVCRQDDDVDIIMTSRFRKMYGSGLVIVSNEIEMHSQNELFVRTDMGNEGITDDEIICRKENYFWFRGIKFMTLNLVYKQKQLKNNIEELRRIEYFYNLQKAYLLEDKIDAQNV